MKLSETSNKLLRKRRDFLSEHPNLTIDADTHITNIDALDPQLLAKHSSTPNYYHGRPISTGELIAEMDMAQVDMSLCWQNPAATRYVEDPDQNYERLLEANAHIYESALKHPGRILPAGWTDPKALGIKNALRLVDHCVENFAFPIVKMNPGQNAFPIDSDPVIQVLERIVEHGATPAFHYGGDTEFTPAEGLENLAKRFPETRIIAVHMGGGGSHYAHGEETYIKTRELGLKYPNLFFVLSAKRDCHIESDLITYQLAGEPYCKNIACGSDAPYGRMTWNFGGYHCMFTSLLEGSRHTDHRLRENPNLFDQESIKDYLGNNFRNLYLASIESVLSKQL